MFKTTCFPFHPFLPFPKLWKKFPAVTWKQVADHYVKQVLKVIQLKSHTIQEYQISHLFHKREAFLILTVPIKLHPSQIYFMFTLLISQKYFFFNKITIMKIQDATLSYPCIDFNKSSKVHHYYFKHVFEDFSLSELVPYQLISKKQSQEHDEMKFSKKNIS